MSDFFKQFAPAKRGESDKFSWNLYRWLREYSRRYGRRVSAMPPRIIQAPDTSRYLIGFFDDDGWFVGEKIVRVLVGPMSARAPVLECCAFSPELIEKHKDVTDLFWSEYARIGRCLFDIDHEDFMLYTDDRYRSVNPYHRECKWCGRTQLLTERAVTKTRQVWIDAPHEEEQR